VTLAEGYSVDKKKHIIVTMVERRPLSSVLAYCTKQIAVNLQPW
jgi:hypothetical protein